MAFTVLSAPVEATTHHRSTWGTTDGSLALAIASAAAFAPTPSPGRAYAPAWAAVSRVSCSVWRVSDFCVMSTASAAQVKRTTTSSATRTATAPSSSALPDLPGAHSILIRLVLTRLIVLPPNIGPTGVTHGCR